MVVSLKSSKKDIMKSVIILFVISNFFIFSKYASTGAKIGLNYCLNTLIPTLLPFIIISLLVVNSGLSEKMGYLLNPFTKLFFNLPGCAGSTILVSLLGGYPTGANGVVALWKKGLVSEKQAERMLYFTVAGGPAFIISVLGETLLRDKKIGLILFVSHIIPVFILGLISGIASTKETYNISKESSSENFSNALIVSSAKATQNMFQICTLVILFSSFLEIFQNSRINTYFLEILRNVGVSSNVAQSVVPMLLEITSGSLTGIKYHVPLPVLSFFISWGGICVQMQIFSMLKEINFSKVKFVLFRLAHGVLSAGMTQLILCNMKYTVQTFNSKSYHFENTSLVFGGQSLVLVLLCICFLISIGKEQIIFKQK